MKFIAAALLLPLASQAMSPSDQYFTTPESALSEYVDAYKARDIERFLAATDFSREAMRQLQAIRGAASPSDTEISERSADLKNELREHLSQTRFKSAQFDNCTQVTRFQDSESQVRIILDCKAPLGSIALPVRIVRFDQGWRVSYGG